MANSSRSAQTTLRTNEIPPSTGEMTLHTRERRLPRPFTIEKPRCTENDTSVKARMPTGASMRRMKGELL